MSEAKLGHLVAIEGNNGVGKSTQIELVAERLRAAGHDVVVVAEPGGSELGVALRKILKDQREIKLNYTTELMLFGAQRDDMYRKVIRPALDAGKVVLADRSYFSTYAHQVHPFQDVNPIILQLFNIQTSVNIQHLGDTLPIVINLTMSEEERLARLAGIEKREEDDFEDRPAEYLAKVAEGYALLEQQPGVTTFDATKPVDELADLIFDQLQVTFNQRVQEAEILREQAVERQRLHDEAVARGEDPEAQAAAAAAEEAKANQPKALTLEEIEEEILKSIDHHSAQLMGMYKEDFTPHQAGYDKHKDNLRKWAARHVSEMRASGQELDAMSGHRMVMQITGNIGQMLGAYMTLLNIDDMVNSAPQAAAPVDEAAGAGRGQTEHVHTFEESPIQEERIELREADVADIAGNGAESSFPAEGTPAASEATQL
jgi:dTMP kinase